MEVAIALCLIVMALAFYSLFRNQLVYRVRMDVLHDETMEISECLERYDRLPSYEYMLYRQPFRFEWQDYLDGKVT